jgi:hypothetical protein
MLKKNSLLNFVNCNLARDSPFLGTPIVTRANQECFLQRTLLFKETK